ncbi:MAG: hypothetical protein KDA45_13150, partial [Planctomycetales bacterium]|nr:hypothetical protein [Planctomycetales bacterium]
TAGHSLLSLLYPPECTWCGQATAFHCRLCPACRQLFVSNYYRCQRCATPLPSVVPNQDCFRCREAKWRFSRVLTLGPYRGELRQAVILMKKPRFELLRRALGELLAEQVLDSDTAPAAKIAPGDAPAPQHPAASADGLSQANGPSTGQGRLPAARQARGESPAGELAPWLVPVPNHWSHGFSSAANTAESLARAIARPTGWRVATRIVGRIRKTAKQGMLSWTERKRNVRGAFAINRTQGLSGRHVMLVDDVLTSGATAAELSRLLLKAGAARVSVLVIARGTGARESPH